MQQLFDQVFAAAAYLPQAYCLGRQSWLVALHGLSDGIIALSYLLIPLAIHLFLRRRRDLPPSYRGVGALFLTFIFATGLIHLFGLITLWYPVYLLEGVLKAVTAAISFSAALVIWPLIEPLAALPSPSQLRDALRELAAARDELEARVKERTRELAETNQRLTTALDGSRITVFSQDRDLRYTWIHNARLGFGRDEVIGRTDAKLLPPDGETVIALKRRVMATGRPDSLEVELVEHGKPVWFRLHVDPLRQDGDVVGVTCAAVDITESKLAEAELERIGRERAEALQRLAAAIRGSDIYLFSQDRDLRYTWINRAAFGQTPEDIVGKTDEEILPSPARERIAALKRDAIDSGQVVDAEISVPRDDDTQWFDLHAEPARNAAGEITGVTCVAVDITERKRYEQHLRLLMRELTHRSKNLLAVIQAMARQTAAAAVSTEAFLDRFGARLQGLASSHDLLVQESWQGASIPELVRAQLGHYADLVGSKIVLEGEPLYLKPEAAQNVGLALHELATNAAKYGALSTPEGRIRISWGLVGDGADRRFRIAWIESGGPEVTAPERRGFGRMVVERNVARVLEGEVELDFAKDGVRWSLVVPVEHVLARTQ